MTWSIRQASTCVKLSGSLFLLHCLEEEPLTILPGLFDWRASVIANLSEQTL